MGQKVFFLVLVVSFLTFWNAHAFQDQTCGASVAESPEKKLAAYIEKVLPQISGCEDTRSPEAKEAAAKKLIASAPGNHETKKIFVTPTSRTGSSVKYEIPGEIKLSPNEAIYFSIPQDLSKRAVNFAVLGHRQDPGLDKNAEYDNEPGLSSVQLHSTSLPEGEAWRYWTGSASGKNGAKFAERRDSYNPELEGLYEWKLNGHAPVGGFGSSHDPLYTDLARIVSVGKDPVFISQLEVKVYPPKASEHQEAIFSKGTAFAEDGDESKIQFGGGQGHGGLFPGALTLRNYKNDTSVTLPEGWYLDKGDLVIPVRKGLVVTGVDISVGDSHPDGVRNKDGGTGTSGWSKLSMSMEKSDGSVDSYMNQENVPPQGVLYGAPSDCGYVTQSGDKIRIRAEKDNAYIMGIRIGYAKP